MPEQPSETAGEELRPDDAFAFFTPKEAAAAEAAMARILPDDELGPGAREAGAVHYLDRALAGAEHRHQGSYRSGLRRLDAAAAERFGVPFASCPETEQDELLTALSTGDLPTFGSASAAAAFFDALRAHTLEGMFSDPAHGGNRGLAGWKLLGYPGPQPGYSHAEQQLDAPIVRDRIFTASDYPLPADGATP